MNISPQLDISNIIQKHHKYGVSGVIDTLLHPAFSTFIRTIIIELIEYPAFNDDDFLSFIIRHREAHSLSDEMIRLHGLDRTYKNDVLELNSIIRTIISKLLKVYPSPEEYVKTKSYLFNVWVYEHKCKALTISKLKTFRKIHNFDVDVQIIDLITEGLGENSTPYTLSHTLNEITSIILDGGNMVSELLIYALKTFSDRGKMVDSHDLRSLRNRCYNNGYSEEFEKFYARMKLCNRLTTE